MFVPSPLLVFNMANISNNTSNIICITDFWLSPRCLSSLPLLKSMENLSVHKLLQWKEHCLRVSGNLMSFLREFIPSLWRLRYGGYYWFEAQSFPETLQRPEVYNTRSLHLDNGFANVFRVRSIFRLSFCMRATTNSTTRPSARKHKKKFSCDKI